MKTVIILGIDPGTTAIGYALLACEKNKEPNLLTAGLVTITTSTAQERLNELHNELKALIKNYTPQQAAVERLFFTKNTKTALSVSEARGAILLTTALAGLTVCEYTPLEIKKAVTGDGAADKLQVKKMLQLTLPQVAKLRARDDVFDAIAVALTCYYSTR